MNKLKIERIRITEIKKKDTSVNISQQIMRLQKGYSACAEGKNQRKVLRVTVTVTVKATDVNIRCINQG